MKIWTDEGDKRSWHEVPANKAKFRMVFENGWTASVIIQAHGLNSCMAAVTSKPSKFKIGPQEAFDIEVVTWLAEVAAWDKAI